MDRHADIAFVDGAVLGGSGDHAPGQPTSGAVAVRGDRILSIDPDEVRELVGPATEIVSLRGRLLIPGFIDAHAHPIWGGLELGECDLTGGGGREQYLATIADYAAARPEAAWITGAGWAMDAFPGGRPHRRDLDAIVADRPVYLPNRDHHGSWVNGRALEIAGIDASTPDPSDGRIERDEDGQPSGMLHEGASDLVARHLPPTTDAEFDAALARAQDRLHALGIVGWQDAIVGGYLGRTDPFDAYLRAAADGRLTARVVGALWWERDRGLEQLDQLRERRERAAAGWAGDGHPGAGRFRASAVKIMLDGIAETQTAAMLSPYLDRCGHTAGAGDSFLDPIALREYVTALDAAGFQVHFHALGDRAVRDALDAVAAARRANGPAGPRHHLAHLQVVHPDDIPRFAELGAAANIQPLWACHDAAMDELTIPFLGPERSAWQYPFAALAAAGARLAGGSDWPVSSPNPLEGIHVAVTRVAPDDPGAAPFLPAQRLSLSAALHAYTAGSAWVNGWADAGTIRPGAVADLAVLDRDPFAGEPEQIASTRVLATYIDGRAVYTDPAL